MDGLSLGNKTAEFVSSVLLKCDAVSRQQYQVIKSVMVRTISDEHVECMVKVRIFMQKETVVLVHTLKAYIHTFLTSALDRDRGFDSRWSLWNFTFT